MRELAPRSGKEDAETRNLMLTQKSTLLCPLAGSIFGPVSSVLPGNFSEMGRSVDYANFAVDEERTEKRRPTTTCKLLRCPRRSKMAA